MRELFWKRVEILGHPYLRSYWSLSRREEFLFDAAMSCAYFSYFESQLSWPKLDVKLEEP